MKRIAITLLILFGVAAFASAHTGEVHSYMGTITTLHKDSSFTLEKTDGKTMRVLLAKNTTYLRADGRAANASELKEGLRVVVKIADDGKTALSIKMAGSEKK